MTALPDSIRFDTVTTALTVLGIPVENLRSVAIERNEIVVEQIRTNAAGFPLAIDGLPSTVTTTIGIDR